MLEVSNVALPLDAGAPKAAVDVFLRKAVAGQLHLNPKNISQVKLLRRSVDARKKGNVHFVATIAFEVKDPKVEAKLLKTKKAKEHVPYQPLRPEPFRPGACRPVVVGMGPAGLFCALYLVKAGARPLVVERGADVDARRRAVDAFSSGGPLNTSTNVQFGEGGAGTFSDGKLTTNTKNPRIAHVLHWFVEAGAPKEILWQAHPHIGSDKLPGVVRRLRQKIEDLGGEVRFNTCLQEVQLSEGKVSSVTLKPEEGEAYQVSCQQLVLACGHSARDTFVMARDLGLHMQRKPFSMGVRIEHRQSAVNQAQWGKASSHKALGAAEYKLVQHLPGGRNVYSFCMCPGGVVMASASEEGGVVTNGMSYFARDGKNANAALLVDVQPEDFGGDDNDVLAGVALQRQVEQAAYQVALQAGGAPFQAPAQTVASFLSGDQEDNELGWVKPTYGPGVVLTDLRQVLPDFVCDALAEAIPLLDGKLAGFNDPAAVMTAPETRSSSPVRILRGADLQAFVEAGAAVPVCDAGDSSVSVCDSEAAVASAAPWDDPEAAGGTGIYPCGEGPGYAGGIMSAAVDGLRIAEAVCKDSAL